MEDVGAGLRGLLVKDSHLEAVGRGHEGGVEVIKGGDELGGARASEVRFGRRAEPRARGERHEERQDPPGA